jgi:hypothetical protein
MSSATGANRRDPLAVMRRLILAVWALGAVGTLVDLWLLEHYEDTWQLIPLALIGLAGLVLAWHLLTQSRVALRGFQLAMVLCLVSGATGVVLHYRANSEFQLEIDPAMSGRELFWKVIHAKAPPALAPGVMVQLGLFGLLFTVQHPALREPRTIDKGDQL